jgi:hypothetical protein
MLVQIWHKILDLSFYNVNGLDESWEPIQKIFAPLPSDHHLNEQIKDFLPLIVVHELDIWIGMKMYLASFHHSG